MKSYLFPQLRELADQQVRFTPPTRRLEQLQRAERLLSELDAKKSYPYQFVCFRITDFRPDTYADLVIPGADLEHDLGLLIAQLARSMPAVPIESVEEPVLSLEEISKKLNVTTKTIHRWRQRGLIGIPVVSKGRRQVGFLASLVEPFLKANEKRVEKSGKFSQLSEHEKQDILRRARRFVRLGVGSLTQVSRRIARRLKRSPETVRYTIKNFDRDHPEQALFPQANGPLDANAKQMIFNSYRRGVHVDTLAKNFQRTRSCMYRVLNEVRAQRLIEQPHDYMYHPSFDDPSQEAAILAEMPGQAAFEDSKRNARIPKDAPPELASLFDWPLLTKEQEQHLFRKMNYLKHRAGKLIERFKLADGSVDCAKVSAQDLDRIDENLEAATRIKDILINCNMRLVVSMAKRHSAQTDNLFELVSDGNISLIRAVEKFDFSRGNKFSTYACWAIMKNFARTIPEELTRRERFVTGNTEVFDLSPDRRTNERELVATAEQATTTVNHLLETLDPREREIIRLRAGLDDGPRGLTLEKIGEKLGITKERVRQINVKAMKKLRGIVQAQKDEM